MNFYKREGTMGMKREWLKPFALGVAIASIASTGAWLYSKFTEPKKLLVLTYVQAEGLDQPKLPPDPAPQSDEFKFASDYVIKIARSCGMRSWTTDNSMGLDAPLTAELEVPLSDVSNKTFNCLTRYVRPQRVTVEIRDVSNSY